MGSILRVKNESSVYRVKETMAQPVTADMLTTTEDKRAQMRSVIRNTAPVAQFSETMKPSVTRTYKPGDIRSIRVAGEPSHRTSGQHRTNPSPQTGEKPDLFVYSPAYDTARIRRERTTRSGRPAGFGKSHFPSGRGLNAAKRVGRGVYSAGKKGGRGVLHAFDPEAAQKAKEDPGVQGIVVAKQAGTAAGQVVQKGYGAGKKIARGISKGRRKGASALRGSARVARKTSTVAVKTTVKTTRTSTKAAAKTVQTVTRASVKAAQAATRAAVKVGQLVVKATAALAKAVASLATAIAANPPVAIALGAVAFILLLVVLISSWASPVVGSPPDMMGETKYQVIVTYLRERDEKTIADFNGIGAGGADSVVHTMEITPDTDPKLMAAYLWVLLGSENFNNITDRRMQQEIDRVYDELYRIETRTESTRKTSKDKDGKEVTTTWTTRIVTLKGKALADYLAEYVPTVFTIDQEEYYNHLVEMSKLAGGTTSGGASGGGAVALPPGTFTGGPFEGWRNDITGHFGIRAVHPVTGVTNVAHKGTDIGKPSGTGIFAVMGGTVTTYPYSSSYGNYMDIVNGSVRVRYAHCSAIFVTNGQLVNAGEVVAAVGSTGRSTWPHLHIEVIVDGAHVDPETYLP